MVALELAQLARQDLADFLGDSSRSLGVEPFAQEFAIAANGVPVPIHDATLLVQFRQRWEPGCLSLEQPLALSLDAFQGLVRCGQALGARLELGSLVAVDELRLLPGDLRFKPGLLARVRFFHPSDFLVQQGIGRLLLGGQGEQDALLSGGRLGLGKRRRAATKGHENHQKPLHRALAARTDPLDVGEKIF